jgi:hypothetical protein
LLALFSHLVAKPAFGLLFLLGQLSLSDVLLDAFAQNK